jgi:drug/metabolite transporter (DMT)-like permease
MHPLSTISLLILFAFAGLVTGLGDYGAKLWALGHNKLYLLLGILTYNISNIAWFYALQRDPQVARMTLIWSIMLAAISMLVGLIIFHEKLSLLNWAGAAAAFIGICLLTR